MNADLLQQPLSLGLGLLSAGVLLFIVFALPALVFPRSGESGTPEGYALPEPSSLPDADAPPAPEPDFTPILKEKIESAWRPLADRLAALEDRPAPVPSAAELRGFYDGLDRLKKGLEDVRALSLPLSAGARDQEALRRHVEELVHRARPLSQWAPAPEGAPERLTRRLAAWREAWVAQLRGEDSALSAEKNELESRRVALEARMSKERSRFSTEQALLASDKEAFARDRRRFEEETAVAAASEKARLESALRAAEERTQSFRREIAGIEERRTQEAAVSEEASAAERRRAREDQSRWREALKKSAGEAAAQRFQEESAIKELQEAGLREAGALQTSINEARGVLERDRAALAAAEAALRGKVEKESGEITARLGELQSQAEALEKTRNLLADTLRGDLEAHQKEMATLHAWAGDRATVLSALSTKAAEEAQSSLDKIQAEKNNLAKALSSEKDGARRDLAALQTGAAEERERFEASLRGAETEHRNRMAALAREDALLKKRLVSLEEETEKLRQRAERLRVKASERLFRHRASFEKSYVEARQKSEAQAVDYQDRQARERWAVQALEARLAVRRRRLETLRSRRREALASLLKGAQASLEAAVDAQRRTEGLVQERVAALKGRAASWGSLKERWSSAPRWIADGARSAEEGIDMASSAEMSGLLASAERQGEEALRAFIENRSALESAATRLKEREAALDREETDVRELLNTVASQSARLERLKIFFEAARFPAASAQERSQVA